MSNTDDDDDYVTIGTPFDIPDEDEPLPKATKIEDQIVTDKQGRRRLHGAFTGGFSAGYFNTVGSKEGWTPSAFKSSRSTKNMEAGKDVKPESKPEDFMDEEDFAEYGIAPKKLKTVAPYNSIDTKLEGQKRSFLKAVDDGKVHSAIPGGIPLDDLLISQDYSVGIQLLKKLGWKPGQGIGEKVALPSENEDISVKKKVYGCALPPKSKVESVDIHSFTSMLAPKDIQPIKFVHKDNFHGIGYSGLHAMTQGSDTGKVFRPNGTGYKGICGQAFGIGVFEDNDECDVYGDTALSRFDMTMCDDVDPKDGWTGTTSKSKVYKDCLTGFVKSLKKLSILVSPLPSIKIPNVIPRHTFTEDNKNDKSKPITKDGASVSSGSHARLSSQERSSLLGEVTKTMDDVSHWTLKWDKKGTNKDILSTGECADTAMDNKAVSGDVNMSMRLDKDVNQICPKQKTDDKGDIRRRATSLYSNKTGIFKPFSKDPEKQARYELFLSSRNKPDFIYESSITEWEKEQEIAEFSRAAVLYQPLTSAMSNRFVPADFKENVVKEEPADKKAAEMEMFGKLTRTVLEWHPDPILCKRMNIPNPFPNSSMKGVPSRNKKHVSIFSDTFVEDMKTITAPEVKEDTPEDEFISRVQKNKMKTLKTKSGPLSHLNININCPQLGGNSVNNIQPSSSTISNAEKEDLVKPSIDIFKAIFENSDSESSDDDKDIIEKEKDLPMSTNLSETNKSNTSLSHSSINNSTIKSNFVVDQTLMKDSYEKVTENKHLTQNLNNNLLIDATQNKNDNIVVHSNERNKKVLPLAFLNTGGSFKGLATSEIAECSNSSGVNRTQLPPLPRPPLPLSPPPSPPPAPPAPAPQPTSMLKSTLSDDKHSCVSQLDTKRKHDKTKHKKRKKSKKSKKGKKHKKRDSDSDSESDSNYEEIKKYKPESEKKYKKKKSKRHGRSSSSSSDETFTPSDALLLEKIKKCTQSSRPTAADFM